MISPSPKLGVVVLLDFLGVSTFDARGCTEFLSKRVKVLERLELAKKEVAKFGAAELSIRTFGDSILVTWPTGIVHSDDVLVMGEVLKIVFHTCIANQILLRGAVSAGEFVETQTQNDSVAVGPAVADAAAWFEAADWSGIIATPRTGHLLDFRQRDCICTGDPDPALMEGTFVKHSVPIRSKGATSGESKEMRRLWCLAWPEWLTRISGSNEKRAATFYEQISFFKAIPRGTEQKYSNTMEFFEWYWNEVLPRVSAAILSHKPLAPK